MQVTQSEAMPVLEVEDLRVAYSGTEVVRGVDVTIRAGERVGIVGESGSGKSTVALALLRLLPENGEIVGGTLTVDGVDTSDFGQRELNGMRGTGIALVAQDPLTALDPVKTIGYQMREALKRRDPKLGRRAADVLAAELLTTVGVPDAVEKLRQYPHQYSGGMRQRVCIAMAIALKPRLLLADEPTTALDVTTQAQVLELLEDLVEEERFSVLIISHDLGIIHNFCDRVLVMYAGRVVEAAEAGGIFTNPRHPYTRALVDSLPSNHRDRAEPLPYIPGSPPPMDAVGIGCAFADRCPLATSVCREVAPPIVAIDGAAGHHVECHHTDLTESGRGDRMPVLAGIDEGGQDV